jgi:hypothetical protein
MVQHSYSWTSRSIDVGITTPMRMFLLIIRCGEQLAHKFGKRRRHACIAMGIAAFRYFYCFYFVGAFQIFISELPQPTGMGGRLQRLGSATYLLRLRFDWHGRALYPTITL